MRSCFSDALFGSTWISELLHHINPMPRRRSRAVHERQRPVGIDRFRCDAVVIHSYQLCCTGLAMSSPLAWQGDGPPQKLSLASSAHCSDQFDTSQSLASLTFIAAQLSTLLHSITLASSATAPPALNPHPTASISLPLHSPSSTLLPLSNSLTLCHCNLVSALSKVPSVTVCVIV